MRLIDAYALQNEIYKSKMQNPHKDAKTAANHEIEHNHFMRMVIHQPTAQEEIVRCKDCRYYDPEWIDEECRLFNNFTTEPDWFCADGERR